MTTLHEAVTIALKAIEQGESFDHLDNVVAPILRNALAAKKLPLDKAQKALLDELKGGPKKVSDMDTIVSRRSLMTASRQLLKRGLIHIESFTFGQGEPSRVFALGPRVDRARVDRMLSVQKVVIIENTKKSSAKRDIAASWI